MNGMYLLHYCVILFFCVYTKDEKVYYTGNSNSFTNFVQSITGLTVKSVSPRTIKILNNIDYMAKYSCLSKTIS